MKIIKVIVDELPIKYTCVDCPLRAHPFEYEGSVCKAIMKSIDYIGVRPSWCPLELKEDNG